MDCLGARPTISTRGQHGLSVSIQLEFTLACPLPPGEGECFPALAKVHRFVTFSALPLLVPSPRGEGQGEGEPYF